jgi:hypothetical protein
MVFYQFESKKKQISHVSEVVVNTRIKLPKKSLLSLFFQVFHDYIIEKIIPQ